MAAAAFKINENPRDPAQVKWNLVAQKGNELLQQFPNEETIFITSEDVPMMGIRGGRTFECDIKCAAQRLVDRTHRLATKEEVARYHEDDRRQVAQLAALEEKKKEKSILKPSQEQMQSQADQTGAVVEAVLGRVFAALAENGVLGGKPARGRQSQDTA
jgi:hypothetical protein